jgi:hypothetical protein
MQLIFLRPTPPFYLKQNSSSYKLILWKFEDNGTEKDFVLEK